jgi:hypothetical protein
VRAVRKPALGEDSAIGEVEVGCVLVKSSAIS